MEFGNAELRAATALSAVLVVGGLALGGDTAPNHTPQGVFIDCASYPGASVGTLVNTLKTSETDIGDVDSVTNEWRERITVEGLGAGEFALIAGGFGPVLTYEDVISGALENASLTNAKSGSTVTVGMPPAGMGRGAPVQVTYTCGPKAGR